jgi:GAF domain-containing protein
VSHDITSILDIEKLLNQAVDIICDEFDFYYAGVFLLDESGEWAVLRAGRGEAGEAMLAEEHKLKVDGLSMIGAATGRREARIALDVGEEPVHFNNPHLPNTRSEMALPLIASDEVIGALTVQSTKEAAFSEDDITALQAMADQLAVAIRNARLHTQNQALLERTERHARLLEAASQVGRDVTSILDLDELLNKAVDIICDAYGFYYSGVFLTDEAGEWAVLRTGHGEPGQAMLDEEHRLKVGGHSMIGAATGQREARIALDVGEEPVRFDNPHLPETHSEMALPLIAHDEVIGAVTVQSTKEAAFSEDDITSLQAMADQLAVSISNARALEELEKAHQELVRAKTFEALATSTIEAIHWIGNKALPISSSITRLQDDLKSLEGPENVLSSMEEDLQMIADSAELIASVQEHLIGPAREEQPRPTMLEDVVRDAAVELEIPDEIISYDVAPDLPRALTDTTQLRRAFEYVLTNAMEAIEGAEEQGITIEVEPTEDNQYIAVHIADTGPGIPEEELDKIWATFYTTKGLKHAGLGLSATLQIIQQMDGEVSASNTADGGAQIELLLPIFDRPLPTEELPADKAILLVDDADPWSRFATELLRNAGNTVIRSDDGKADPGIFDLVLVDDVLAGTETVSVLKRLREAEATDRTIVVASGQRVERTMELTTAGVQDVVLKPYTPAELADVVR